MDLVNDDGLQVGKEGLPVLLCGKQRHLLGRRQQDVGRPLTLSRAFRLRRIASARLDAQGQPHLLHGRHQIARHVLGQRLERRNIQSMQPVGPVAALPLHAPGQIDKARQETAQRLAATGRRDQQGVLTAPGRLDHLQLVRTRRPAARGEPVGKPLWQHRRKASIIHREIM